MSGQRNGEVWRALVDAYNASQPPENRVQNPFGDPSQSHSPTTSASKSRLKINVKQEDGEDSVEYISTAVDYPGKLLYEMEAIGINGFVREYRFHQTRQWRLDLAHPDLMIGVECHGGVFTNGRHNRGLGFTNDREKMNAAIQMGWIVLEFTSGQIKSGKALTTVGEVHTNRICEFAG